MFTFKIGADPEFLFYHNNRMAPASKSITYALKKHPTAYPETSMGFKVKTHGELGWDGANNTGEMRPTPSKDPYEVANNVGEIIKAAAKELPYLTMTSLSIGAPIGGHIHLEVPVDSDLRNATETRKKNIIKILATFLTPIVASEHKLSTAIRFSQGSYGKLDDVRIGNVTNSDAMTYEVRGTSAEWTCHPEITRATLAYLGVVWNEILTTPTAQLMRSPFILKTTNQVQAIHTLLISEYTPIFDGVIDNLHNLVKTYKMYNEYKADIDLIFDVAKASKMKEEIGWNLNRGWNTDKLVESPIQLTKRTFLSNKEVTTQMKKMDFDTVNANHQGIVYNDDFNMGGFMSTLGERLTAFNIALQNEYYFFGLRKGVEDFLIATQADEEMLYAETPKNLKKEEIKEILSKMSARYGGRRVNTRTAKIDPKTGKNMNAKKQAVVYVGIPYETRAESDTRTFLSKLWDIEHNANALKKYTELPEPVLSKTNHKEDKTNQIPTEILENLREEGEQPIPQDLLKTND